MGSAPKPVTDLSVSNRRRAPDSLHLPNGAAGNCTRNSWLPATRDPVSLRSRDGIGGSCTRVSAVRKQCSPTELRPRESQRSALPRQPLTYKASALLIELRRHEIGLGRFALPASPSRQLALRTKKPLTERNPFAALCPKHAYRVNRGEEKNRNNCFDQEVHILILPISSVRDLHPESLTPEASALLD